MKRIYYNPNHPAGFSSVARLARAVKLPQRIAKDWLLKQEVYSTHFPARKKSRNISFYNAYFPNQTWEIDLCDMQKLAMWNKPYRYILTIIDIFSRQAQARAVKTKKPEDIANALEDVLKTCTMPERIQSDEGKEFTGRVFQNLLKEYDIKFRLVRNQVKGSIIERFNRTLKTRMWKYFNYKETYRWIEVLPQLIIAYNKSQHRSLGNLAPNQVTAHTAYEVWKNNYLKHLKIKTKKDADRFAVGDFVRISKHKKVFDKAYTQSFTTEVFRISEILYINNSYMYRLTSLLDEELKGLFYAHEILRVYYVPDKLFKIDEILSRRLREDGTEESLIKWKGWHESHNSWIPSIWIKKI